MCDKIVSKFNSMNEFNEHGVASTVEYIALRRAELQAEYEKYKRQVEIMLEQGKKEVSVSVQKRFAAFRRLP